MYFLVPLSKKLSCETNTRNPQVLAVTESKFQANNTQYVQSCVQEKISISAHPMNLVLIKTSIRHEHVLTQCHNISDKHQQDVEP